MTGNGPSSSREPPRHQEQESDRPGGREVGERDTYVVVAIGASAGGLDAARKLIDALPPTSGLALILVQHLDPNHESMLVELLASHTRMRVQQAAEGMLVEPDNLYVIPPGVYLSIADGALHLSPPKARQGTRLPFDFLLQSLAAEYGARAVGVVLSGTGTDGSLGLEAVHAGRGLVIAQDPEEAGYDGMPRSAILTGTVDRVLPAGEIPDAIITYARQLRLLRSAKGSAEEEAANISLAKIIDLLRVKTSHNFTLYKPGTLQRRIERRMALASLGIKDMESYLAVLEKDPDELDLLAKDLLINVTRFFRDPKVFDLLAEKVIPEIIRNATPDRPLRIWIAGCSTGEETYSLTMLFREQIAAAESPVKLQVFASDVDPDAVTIAREGFYPKSIESDVPPERLARFFSKEDDGYRVLPELRASVIFTVQDVLADPPFSRLDLVSCRNLLIYLGPVAQAKVISLFHFALREGGVLLLGNAESIGNPDGRFEPISKAQRIYRHIGRSRPGDLAFSVAGGDQVRIPARIGLIQSTSRQATLAELCRRLVLENFAPAAVLINRKNECLFTLGRMDRFLTVASGHPTHDVLALARPAIRTKLRAAIQQAIQANARTAVGGGRIGKDDSPSFSIDVQPLTNDGEELLLICFVDEPVAQRKHGRSKSPADASRIAQLEQELEATRAELQSAIRNLEMSSEDQRAINEEALSVSEEFQSTNEELLTSKEELQSLNEELTALNSQLQETLEKQRTTSNDLQNVLYSTDLATLFLDRALNIRFFTPATRSLFSVIPSDVGRPLADLHSLATDSALLTDAQAVLARATPIEREIEAPGGVWYVRRILPYRTQDNGIEGVVITFSDITERKRTADALEHAKREAELATVAKSRFLAAASHDLRQPLQTLTLLQGLLARSITSQQQQKLVARLDDTLSTMSGMLNTLLDINQIEAGIVRAEPVRFSVDGMLVRLRDEFAYHAQAQRLALHTVPCSQTIRSDPQLLEQMIRNLLSNAFKYTQNGTVLLGCRRRSDMLSIEIWDTGSGIPGDELQAIFDEYHQLDNAARERDRGLGLGLSIVKRLADLLGHRVRVRSVPGKGSMFAIEVPLSPGVDAPIRDEERLAGSKRPDVASQSGGILLVEDDMEMRGLLEMYLAGEGHRVASATDGIGGQDLVANGLAPDLILADYNLPHGMNGLELAIQLRSTLQRQISVIILTGDISTDTLRSIARQQCVQLHKPVKLNELSQIIQRLLPRTRNGLAPAAAQVASGTDGTDVADARPVVFVVDDDDQVREAIRHVFEEDGQSVAAFASCEAFLAAYRPDRDGCLVIDAYLPGMSGLELLQQLRDRGHGLPAIMITGNSDVSMAVAAMKAGASDFIEKPVGRADLLASVERALEQSRDSSKLAARRQGAASRLGELTERQREIMELVLAGHPSKNIAADLGISQRTVENHRAAIMKKTGSKSLPALARLALAARDDDGGDVAPS